MLLEDTPAFTAEIETASLPVQGKVDDLTECGNCMLLLTEIPAVDVARFYVLNGRAIRRTLKLDHIHVARPDKRVACRECFETTEPCPIDHALGMCDTPAPLICETCKENTVMPGKTTCIDCPPPEPQWDPDLYYRHD